MALVEREADAVARKWLRLHPRELGAAHQSRWVGQSLRWG